MARQGKLQGIDDQKVISAVEWYQKNRDFYKRLALKIELMIKGILEYSEIDFHSITSRAKDIESFKKKAGKDKYLDPKTEILDLAGIRITAYVESDVNKICEVIEREFNIIPEHSVNKSEILKYNEVGYRSVHYVAKLKGNRATLPEYKGLDAPFEIQIRTILQHAWAEIEHDRNYKFEGSELPEHAQIKRRFALLAANLETVDREFNAIIRDIDFYGNQVIEDTKKGKLDIPIDSISLTKYLTSKLESVASYVHSGLGHNSKSIVDELLEFGIRDLADLDKLINESDFIEKIKKHGKKGFPPTNFISTLRRLMIMNDAEKYFEKSYGKHGVWRTKEDGDFAIFLAENGVNKEILSQNKLFN